MLASLDPGPARIRLALAGLLFLVARPAWAAGADGGQDAAAPTGPAAHAPAPASATPPSEWWSLHFASTVATQAHPGFGAQYTGPLSMTPDAEAATAFVSTLGLDVRLWRTGELVFDPEVSGGFGLSGTEGVAAFPSGIVYRVGDPAPTIYLARLLVRETIGLGGGSETVAPGMNQLAGTRDRNHLTLTVGRLSVTDVFDGNAYAHDPTTQFFDWALFASGAWDYPADTRGYTWGVLGELTLGWWSARAGIALEPLYANLTAMDWNVLRSHGLMAEYEARYTLAGYPGASRALVYLNVARMGSYAQVLDDPAAFGNQVQATRAFGRVKYGAALSVDQQLPGAMGAFLRASWDDGATETWAFTEIDRSLAAGLVKDGSLWGWRDYEAGGAFVVDGLSGLHRAYLASGGLGFIIGDGKLTYEPEMEGDFYFRVQLTDFIQLSALYQPVFNPAYNLDRGPISVFTGRLKVSF